MDLDGHEKLAGEKGRVSAFTFPASRARTLQTFSAAHADEGGLHFKAPQEGISNIAAPAATAEIRLRISSTRRAPLARSVAARKHFCAFTSACRITGLRGGTPSGKEKHGITRT